MGMVCPQCSTAYEQRLQCPLCGTRLLYADPRSSGDRPRGGPTHWQQKPWGRILIGLVLAQGLFYGLRHLLTAVLMALQGEEAVQQMWTAASGILLLQGVRIVALLGGAVLAGVGQRQALFLGAIVGTWNGALAVLLLDRPAASLTTIAVLGQPLLQAAVGAIGAWLGAMFWKPLSAELPNTLPTLKRTPSPRPLKLMAGPVAWLRVGTGVALAVIGTLTATITFEKVLEVSHGTLATADDMQDRLITLEIKALALLLGGAWAGATTSNGFKQGLCVGFCTAVVLIGIEMNYVERWLQVGALTAVCCFCLSVVGGWFGSQLFPPIIRVRRKRGLDSASL